MKDERTNNCKPDIKNKNYTKELNQPYMSNPNEGIVRYYFYLFHIHPNNLCFPWKDKEEEGEEQRFYPINFNS